jgi:hypothetical protein
MEPCEVDEEVLEENEGRRKKGDFEFGEVKTMCFTDRQVK